MQCRISDPIPTDIPTDEIVQVGYQYAKKYLADLRDDGQLPVNEESEEKRNLRRTMAQRRASI